MKKLIMATTLALISLGTFAGDKGNGGGAFYCNNETIMADILEGSYRHGLEIPTFSGFNYSEIKDTILNKLIKHAPLLSLKVLKELNKYEQNNVKMNNSNLFETKDYNYIIVPNDCKYTQLANWDKLSGKILINNDVYEKLSTRDQVALAFHESIYSVLRKTYNNSSSDKTRMLTSYLFSNSSTLPFNIGEEIVKDEMKEGSFNILTDKEPNIENVNDKYNFLVSIETPDLDTEIVNLKSKIATNESQILISRRKTRKRLAVENGVLSNRIKGLLALKNKISCSITFIEKDRGYNSSLGTINVNETKLFNKVIVNHNSKLKEISIPFHNGKISNITMNCGYININPNQNVWNSLLYDLAQTRNLEAGRVLGVGYEFGDLVPNYKTKVDIKFISSKQESLFTLQTGKRTGTHYCSGTCERSYWELEKSEKLVKTIRFVRSK